MTNVQLNESIVDRLKKLKRAYEYDTYNEVIDMLLDVCEILLKEPQTITDDAVDTIKHIIQERDELRQSKSNLKIVPKDEEI